MSAISLLRTITLSCRLKHSKIQSNGLLISTLQLFCQLKGVYLQDKHIMQLFEELESFYRPTNLDFF
jgi:hypothetical protein